MLQQYESPILYFINQSTKKCLPLRKQQHLPKLILQWTVVIRMQPTVVKTFKAKIYKNKIENY